MQMKKIWFNDHQEPNCGQLWVSRPIKQNAFSDRATPQGGGEKIRKDRLRQKVRLMVVKWMLMLMLMILMLMR